MAEIPDVSDVFVAGGLPTVTYVPREEHGLESQIKEYLQTRRKILSISGPTKSGKTVLVRRIIPKSKGVWISGGQITEISIFWDAILDVLGGHTVLGSTKAVTRTGEKITEGSLAVKPGGIGGEGKRSEKYAHQESSTTTGSRTTSPSITAIARLTKEKPPLIIDDFHYISKEIQLAIIRSLKDPVFEGLPVILISVPHRAFDSVRVEKEMTGRVQQLSIPEWSVDELERIATSGFAVLNSDCEKGVVSRLQKESFKSPHLMQDFCLALSLGKTFTSKNRTVIAAPADWSAFFKARAADASKSAFDRLAQGPRQRTLRKDRTLLDGTKCDIYNAILLAIAQTGPQPKLTYEDLRTGLNNVLIDQIPQANEVTRVLEKMSEISQKEIEGEPVVDWDKDFSILHVSDPFFAYYLRWGVRLPKP